MIKYKGALKEHTRILILVTLYLSLLNFFDLVFIPSIFITGMRAISFSLLLFCFFYWSFLKRNFSPLLTAFSVFLFMVLMSTVYASLVHDVSLPENFIAFSRLSAGLYIIPFLLLRKFTILQIKKSIIIVAILYSVIFVFALRNPSLIKNDDDLSAIESSSSFDFLRVSENGLGFVVVSFFIFLSEYLHERKIVKFLYASILLVFVLLSQTRQIILFTFLVGILHFLFKSNNRGRIYFLVFSIIIFFVIKFSFINDIITGLLDKTSDQNSTGRSTFDARLIEYKYFFTEFKNNFFTFFFGNGMIAERYHSTYGRLVYGGIWKNGWNMVISDVGFAYVFVQWGIIGLLLWLFIFISIFKTKVPKKLDWVKISILAIILFFIGTYSIFNVSFSTPFALCIYILILIQRKELLSK